MWRPPCHSVQGPEAQVHGCATHYTRGADFCSNGKLVERERLENRVLQAIEEVVFAPETVEYLTAKVNEVLRHMTKPVGLVLMIGYNSGRVQPTASVPPTPPSMMAPVVQRPPATTPAPAARPVPAI